MSTHRVVRTRPLAPIHPWLAGCRALYVPSFSDGMKVSPLYGDGPTLLRRTLFAPLPVAIRRGKERIGWDFYSVTGQGYYATVPQHWRRDGFLFEGRGATVLWYGENVSNGGNWTGLAGVMYGIDDGFPNAPLALRKSSSNVLVGQTCNSVEYRELLASGYGQIPTTTQVFVLSAAPDGSATLYANGSPVVVLAAGGSNRGLALNPTTPGWVYIGSNYGGVSNQDTTGHCTYMTAFWDRVLPPSQVAAISRSPALLERLAYRQTAISRLGNALASRLRVADGLGIRSGYNGASFSVLLG